MRPISLWWRTFVLSCLASIVGLESEARADWIQHPEKQLSQIATANPTRIVGVNSSDQILMYAGNFSWVTLSGAAVDISTAPDGAMWVVNRTGQIFREAPGNWSQVAPPTDGGTPTHVSVGSQSSVWLVTSTGTIHKWTGSGWVKIPGALTQISVASDGTVIGVNSAGNVYKWMGSDWAQWPSSPGAPFVQISAGNANAVWAVASGGAIYKWSGSNWTLIPGALKWIAVGADGSVWGVNSADTVWNWSAPAELPVLPKDSAGRWKARLRHVASGKCLYGLSPRDNGIVGSYGCWDDPNMAFKLEPTGSGTFRIMSVWTGGCLYAPAPGTTVQRTWGCWADPKMEYDLNPLGGNNVHIKNRTSGKCVVASSEGAGEAQCDGNATIALEAIEQLPVQWDMTPVPSGTKFAIHVTTGQKVTTGGTTNYTVDRWVRPDAQGYMKADSTQPVWFTLTNVPLTGGECSRAANQDIPCYRWKAQMGARFFGGAPDTSTYSNNLGTVFATAGSVDAGSSLYIFPSGISKDWGPGMGGAFCGWIKGSDAAGCSDPRATGCAETYYKFFPNNGGAMGWQRDNVCGQGGYEIWVTK